MRNGSIVLGESTLNHVLLRLTKENPLLLLFFFFCYILQPSSHKSWYTFNIHFGKIKRKSTKHTTHTLSSPSLFVTSPSLCRRRRRHRRRRRRCRRHRSHHRRSLSSSFSLPSSSIATYWSNECVFVSHENFPLSRYYQSILKQPSRDAHERTAFWRKIVN